jgi:hypothetical protein
LLLFLWIRSGQPLWHFFCFSLFFCRLPISSGHCMSFFSSSGPAAGRSRHCLSYWTAPKSFVMLDPFSILTSGASCNTYQLLEQLLSN